MVERRERLRLKMLNHPISGDAIIAFTGECGSVEAIEKFIAVLWRDWEKALIEWKQGETAKLSPVHCQRLEPSEWRLTDQGVIAREDLKQGNAQCVLDFVLKQGFFDGQLKLVGDTISSRPRVHGKGVLVEFQKTNPSMINIGNWGEGADALSKAMESIVSELIDVKLAQQPNKKNESPGKEKGETKSTDKTEHSNDFTSVIWYGTNYSFTKTQAFVVSLLWKEWEKGTPTLTNSTIREKVGSSADRYRVSHTFRKHPAFGTMIKSNGKGIYRLSPPESPNNHQ